MTGETQKWDWRLDRLCFLDVETTGVWSDPDVPFPLPLEVALIVTTANLRELGRESVVISWPKRDLDQALDPFCRDMHSTSGLLEEVRGGTAVAVGAAEKILIRIMNRLTKDSSAPVIWAGSSPGALDRPVLREWMPELYAKLHHRTLDVSALKLALLNWGGAEPRRYEARHRAMSDCEDAVKLARRVKLHLRRAERALRKHDPKALAGVA